MWVWSCSPKITVHTQEGAITRVAQVQILIRDSRIFQWVQDSASIVDGLLQVEKRRRTGEMELSVLGESLTSWLVGAWPTCVHSNYFTIWTCPNGIAYLIRGFQLNIEAPFKTPAGIVFLVWWRGIGGHSLYVTVPKSNCFWAFDCFQNQVLDFHNYGCSS